MTKRTHPEVSFTLKHLHIYSDSLHDKNTVFQFSIFQKIYLFLNSVHSVDYVHESKFKGGKLMQTIRAWHT